MFSTEELERMAAVDIRTVDINSLSDIRDIQISTKKPVAVKLSEFDSQSSNRYIHRIGDWTVKVVHQKTGPDIDDKMLEYVRRLAEIYI